MTIAVLVAAMCALVCLIVAAEAASSMRKWKRIAQAEEETSRGLCQIVIAQEHVLAQIACGVGEDPSDLAAGALQLTMTRVADGIVARAAGHGGVGH